MTGTDLTNGNFDNTCVMNSSGDGTIVHHLISPPGQQTICACTPPLET